MVLSTKQMEFNAAMERYRTLRRYEAFNALVSIANVSLQGYLLYRLWLTPLDALPLLGCLLAAFVLTDFLNGLVHMLMDNNDNYDSIFGPFVANFHLHHKIIQYQRRNLLVVYFKESGSKVWLVGYLLMVCWLAGRPDTDPAALHILVYTGILSSVAEVSHYLCHSSDSKAAILVGNARVLLPKRHHARHHMEDNRNYAFLNGITDPLLNPIAAALFKGYKRTTDTHYAHYETENNQSR